MFNHLQNYCTGRKLECMLYCGMVYYFQFLNISLGWKRLWEDLTDKCPLSPQEPPADAMAASVSPERSQVECSNRCSFTCSSQTLLVRIISRSALRVQDCYLWRQSSPQYFWERWKHTLLALGSCEGRTTPSDSYFILSLTADVIRSLFILLQAGSL